MDTSEKLACTAAWTSWKAFAALGPSKILKTETREHSQHASKIQKG